jgi:hypothetical protein
MALDFKLANYPLCEKVMHMVFTKEEVANPGLTLTIGVCEFSGENNSGLKIRPFNGVVVSLEEKEGNGLSFDLSGSSARSLGQSMIRMADAIDGGWSKNEEPKA